jgi:hypothetical protein
MHHPMPAGPATRALARLPRSLRCLAAALALGALQSTLADPAADAVDSREAYSAASPAWLRAVGKLHVPGSRYRAGRREHLQENCSATLVVSAARRRADTIITAWHCLADYDDLSKPITFTLLPDLPGATEREAYRLADGGGMHADWAILRLYQPIAAHQVQALAVHPGRTGSEHEISMAGYSRDPGMGADGDRLTFDRHCRITGQAPATSHSDCFAHKGASGGAVVQISTQGVALLSGVISQGNGAGFSTFVPVASFYSEIARYLN